MMSKKTVNVRISLPCFLIALIFMCGADIYCQHDRVNTYKVLEGMLAQSEKGEYESIDKSIPFLGEISVFSKENLHVDPEKEIRSSLMIKNEAEKSGKVCLQILKFVYYDIKRRFHEIADNLEKEEQKTLKSWLQMAYMNYSLISPKLKERKFDEDADIKIEFNKGISMLSSAGSRMALEKKESELDAAELVSILDNIEKKIISVFPEFTSAAKAGAENITE
ncbi:MAG: hypothetical protein JXJ19_01545 [Elusimicrobia bacterium]|nr:hypothetical protein [Elusimicrobiota bacterium]